MERLAVSMLHIGCHLSSAKGYLAMGKDAIILNPAQSTTVLLETMAGKGTEIDRSFEELRAIIDRVELQDK